MANRKINVSKVKPIQRKAVQVESLKNTRKINVIQKHKVSGRSDIVVVKPEDSKKSQKVRFDRRPSVKTKRVSQLAPNKVMLNGKNANFDRKINDIKDRGRGKILVMVACGPSVNEIDVTEFDGVDNLDMMIINKPILGITPEYWAFCDHSQYLRNKDVFNSYSKLTIMSNTVRASKTNQVVVQACQGKGIKRDLREGYIIGRSSVYANIQVALWMNYDQIYIFGVDMCAVNGKLHHYGVNPDVPEDKRKERFQFEASHYDRMAEALPDHIRERIFFCSSYNPWGFVSKFNKLDHKKAVGIILEKASSI